MKLDKLYSYYSLFKRAHKDNEELKSENDTTEEDSEEDKKDGE